MSPQGGPCRYIVVRIVVHMHEQKSMKSGHFLVHEYVKCTLGLGNIEH